MNDDAGELRQLRDDQRRLQFEIFTKKYAGLPVKSLTDEMKEIGRRISELTGEKYLDYISMILEALKDSPEESLSPESISTLLELKYPDGRPILNPLNPSEMVEVVRLVRDYPIDEVLDYLSQVESPRDLIFNSPLMTNARLELQNIQNILNREPIAVKGLLGTCYRCGNDRLSMSEVQTRGGDEAMTIYYYCVTCGNTWKS